MKDKSHSKIQFLLISIMRKLIVLFSLLFLINIFFPYKAEASKLKLKVTVEKANIRSKPTTESSIIYQATFGTILESEEKKGNWYKVFLPSEEKEEIIYGYIHHSIVEVLEEKIEVPIKKEKLEEEKKEEEKVEQKPEKKEEKKAEEIAWIISKQTKEKKERTGIKSEKTISAGAGIKIGVNFSSFIHESIDYNSKFGFVFGGFMALNILKYFELQPEILLIQKGAVYEYGNHRRRSNINITYLQIPLLLKLKAQLQNRINPGLFVGPYFSIKLSGKESLTLDGEKIWEGKINDLKTFDFGLSLGGGADVAIDSAKIYFDVRYELGMVSIIPISGEKNRSISISLGYLF